MSAFSWEKVSLINKNNLRLAGLLHTDHRSGAPLVIVCHGFTGSKEGGGRAMSMAEELGRLGLTTLLFDFAGCGESEGDFADLSLTGQINDLSAVLDWCRTKKFGPLITMGRSFGGTTVICQGASDQRVAGVCTWAASARLTDLFLEFVDGSLDDPGDTVFLAGESGILELKKTFFADLEQYDVPACASRLTPRPLLIIHGDRDDVVPLEDAHTLYAAAREPRLLSMISGGDHQFSKHHRQAWDITFRWLKENFS
ncbi:MAG: alpha/beta hydrolase [Bacillota bacterium]|jgi:putative redox protein